jgi:hypothetical protein
LFAGHHARFGILVGLDDHHHAHRRLSFSLTP